MSKSGLLISFEGCEGSGKTTQADLLTERLESLGYHVVRVREPGGTKTGEIIRGILQHDSVDEPIELETEALLFAASRAQMVKQVVDPSLAAGSVVIADRFVDSAIAYQGYGREIGADIVASINSLAIGDTLPSLTFLIDLDVESGLERMRARNEGAGGGSDRIEREDISFHKRVYAGYQEIAEANRDRYVRIDGNLSPDDIFAAVWSSVEGLLPSVPGKVNAK